VGLALATAPGRAFYLPVGHREGTTLDPTSASGASSLLRLGRRLARRSEREFDWHTSMRSESVKDVAFDTMIAAYDPDQPKNLDALSWSRLGLKRSPPNP
jgi:DNA polymerase I-like protein with 3'-5' exonuclease and polymerase domains